MSGYVKFFKGKDKNNKLLSFPINDEKLLEKYKASLTKIEDKKKKKFELNALPVYGDRYIKTKIRTYFDKVYTNFCGLNVQEDDIKCKSFTFLLIPLHYENKYYLQVNLVNCAYKTIDKQANVDYLDD